MSILGTVSKSQWPFSPQSIPGLALWLDAADTSSLTTSSGNVTAWRDKSGTSRTVTFTGTNTYTSSPASVNTNSASSYFSADADVRKTTIPNVSIFLVYKWNSSTSGTNQFLWGGDVGGGWNRIQILTFPLGTSFQYSLAYTGSSPYATPVTGLNNGNLLLYNANYAYGVASGTYVNVNGSLATSLVTEAAASAQTSYSGVNFGNGNGDVTYACSASFSEIIIYYGILAATQRQQVEGYLAQKWGLQPNLPATHPYYATSTTQLYKQPVFQRPFSPVDISACQLWLDASDATTITGTTSVSAWKDKSGLGNNATSAGSAITYSSAGLYFGGSSYCTVPGIAGTLANTPFVIFIVETITGTSGYLFGDDSNSGTNNTLHIGYRSLTDFTFALWGNDIEDTSISGSGNRRIWGLHLPSGANRNIRRNGGVDITGPNATTLGSFTTPVIGRVVGGNYYTGTISEIIVYNKDIGISSIQQVESYLAWKWGLVSSLTLSSHPGKLLPAFSTVFSPKSISGLSLWLDAADQQSMVLSGSSVTSWNDKSGKGYNASGGVSPTYSSNGVQFNGSSYLTTSAPAGNNSATYFIVFNPSSIGFTVLLGGNVASTATLFVGSSTSFVLGDWYNNIATFTTSFSAGTSYLASGMASGGVLSVAINAGTMATGSATFSGTGTFTIGAGYTDNRAKYSGAINEIIVFSSALTTSERQQVEGYLAWKWGLQKYLPATHAFKNIKP